MPSTAQPPHVFASLKLTHCSTRADRHQSAGRVSRRDSVTYMQLITAFGNWTELLSCRTRCRRGVLDTIVAGDVALLADACSQAEIPQMHLFRSELGCE